MTSRGVPARKVKQGRRPGFGAVEKLPSGRFRVRWRDADGLRRTAKQTFATKGDARSYLATLQADQLRQTLGVPKRADETLASYGNRWVRDRPGLKDSTRHQYDLDFRLHIEPRLGSSRLDRIDPEAVRRWHAELSRDLRAKLERTRRDGRATVARCYRLLHSILQTAVDDELLPRNPCRLSGAGEARSVERPVLSAAEIAELAGTVPARYRAFVLLAGFSGLRAGELAALRVGDLDLRGTAPTIRVSRRFYRVAGRLTIDTPKSENGGRTLPLPAFLARELCTHLQLFRVSAERDDLTFVTAGGRDVLDGYSQLLRRALDRMNRHDVRPHDLRHSALTAAAENGATLATLMQLAGHSTPDAAQRYQHVTLQHARSVAAAIDKSAAAVVARSRPRRSTTGTS